MDVNLSQQNGTNIVRLRMARCKEGIRIAVKADPSIEAFFQQWAGGQRPERVDDYGRQWASVDTSKRLMVWPMTTDRLEPNKFTIWHPGRQLTYEGLTNVSFLRLAGISEGDGVVFTVEDLVSRSELDNLADRMKRGCAWFYTEYIKPTGYDIFVDARERGTGPSPERQDLS